MKCDWCPPKCFTQFPDCFEYYPGRCQRKNPGSINELHALAHAVKPKFYDGIEVDYLHRLGTNKLITTNWVLSHTRPSGFRLGGIYTLRVIDDVMLTPIIQADINPSTLASNVEFIYYPFDCLRVAAEFQRNVEDAPLETQLTLELLRPFATMTANLYNPSLECGRSTLSFMRSITNHWAMGAELLLEWNEPKSIMADTAFAARYSHHNYALAATASRQGIDISYWQRVHKRLQMATTFAWHRKTEKTVASICYQCDFTDAVVRGMFNSDLSLGVMYQRTLMFLPVCAGLSVLMNVPSNRFAFGLKFSMDPSGLRRDRK